MATVRIRKRQDSETLHLPELRESIGKDVEVTVLGGAPATPSQGENPLASLARFQSKLPGDPFGPDFEATLDRWGQEPWTASDEETAR